MLCTRLKTQGMKTQKKNLNKHLKSGIGYLKVVILPPSTNSRITIHSKLHYFSMWKSSHCLVLGIDKLFREGTTYKHCHHQTQKQKTIFWHVTSCIWCLVGRRECKTHDDAIDNPRQQESATMAITFSKLLSKCSRIHKGCLDRFGCAFVWGWWTLTTCVDASLLSLSSFCVPTPLNHCKWTPSQSNSPISCTNPFTPSTNPLL
jgi:hypothetical protein